MPGPFPDLVIALDAAIDVAAESLGHARQRNEDSEAAYTALTYALAEVTDDDDHRAALVDAQREILLPLRGEAVAGVAAALERLIRLKELRAAVLERADELEGVSPL